MIRTLLKLTNLPSCIPSATAKALVLATPAMLLAGEAFAQAAGNTLGSRMQAASTDQRESAPGRAPPGERAGQVVGDVLAARESLRACISRVEQVPGEKSVDVHAAILPRAYRPSSRSAASIFSVMTS